MPQVIRMPGHQSVPGHSMKTQSSKVLDWWWVVLLVIAVIGIVTSNEYLIVIGLVVMAIAAILTFALRRRWTIMSSQKV